MKLDISFSVVYIVSICHTIKKQKLVFLTRKALKGRSVMLGRSFIEKEEFLGKEMMVSGQVRRNQMFDSNDFIISEFGEVDVDKLIGELEK